MDGQEATSQNQSQQDAPCRTNHNSHNSPPSPANPPIQLPVNQNSGLRRSQRIQGAPQKLCTDYYVDIRMLQCKKSNQQQPRLESGFLDNYNNNNDTGLENDEASFLMTTLTSEEGQDLTYKNYFNRRMLSYHLLSQRQEHSYQLEHKYDNTLNSF